MKGKIFLAALLLLFFAEIAAVAIFAAYNPNAQQDAAAVNMALQSVREDFYDLNAHENSTGLDYAVLDNSGNVLYVTKEGISLTVNEAVKHRDTMLDITDKSGAVTGKLIIFNDGAESLNTGRKTAAAIIAAAIILQAAICAAFTVYINKTVIKPFKGLKGFAERVAGGNLDVPLDMDRGNIFGAFTESFDIMRSELKKARAAEAEANESKKELVAKLSHDIKTPVASIKAAAEVGEASAKDRKARENYARIIQKADQIDALISNLFAAALEDLKRLTVTAADLSSQEVLTLLKNADYLGRAAAADIPKCSIRGDRLRLQQVFDNIFANSYKYADTAIEISAFTDKGRLYVCIEDEGGGVNEDDLPRLKEKFARGADAVNEEGAGLGLYIADYFMREMGGELVVENGTRGLKVSVVTALSGREV